MNKLSKISGITLVEMLIGVVVSSIMIAAMYTSYTVINNSYSRVTDVAAISRSGHDIVSMMMRDIRMAGFKYYYGYNAENEALPFDQRIPRQDNLNFIAGDTDSTKEKSHAPIVIYRNKLNYAAGDVGSPPSGYDSTTDEDAKWNIRGSEEDVCCDRIHIVYGDFNAEDDQPYKKYRITYYAKPLSRNGDKYYGVFRSQESWIHDPDDSPDYGKWTSKANECNGDCYTGELVREYLTDMSFVAFGKYGEVINADPEANPEKIFDIRSVDVSMTFRSPSKKGFFTKTGGNRIIKSLGRKVSTYTDKFFRDSVFVTVHTRNIGGFL